MATKKEKVSEPLINIIVRTHQRPGYFRKCIESINKQAYENKFVIAIADDELSAKYANEALDEGLIDDVVKVQPAQFKSKDFNKLLSAGIVKSARDKDRHFYDLYLNKVISQVEEGWIIIVDDDKELATANTLKNLSKKLAGEDTVVIAQHQLQRGSVPNDENWKKIPLTRGQIDMACFVFHASQKQLIDFDGHGAGDWRQANVLAGELKPVWYKTVLTIADNNGNSGKPEKK